MESSKFTFEPQPSDILIAVMGITGSGKSTFISHCTQHSVPIGDGLHSHTRDLTVYPCKTDIGSNVYLIDTPGFDDTELEDAQVLRKIATWVGDTYQRAIHLRGILYLHRITDVRMQGAAIRNLFMFKKLCGNNAIKNIILVTTMWEDVKPQIGHQREAELQETPEYWGEMISKGARVARHQNNHDSARAIVRTLLQTTTDTTLAIQREMVDEKKDLNETSAGLELDGIFAQERERFLRQIEDLRKDMAEARELQDRESQEQIRLLQQQRQAEIEKVLKQQESIRVSLEQLFDEKFTKLEQHVATQQRQIEKDERKIAELSQALTRTSVRADESFAKTTPGAGEHSSSSALQRRLLEGPMKLKPKESGLNALSATVSRDHRLIAVFWHGWSGGRSTFEYEVGRVEIYDVTQQGASLRTLVRHRAIRGLAFSPDSRTLATSYYDYSPHALTIDFYKLAVWDRRSGSCLWTDEDEDGEAFSFSPDGRHLARQSRGSVRILDSTTGARLMTLEVSVDQSRRFLSPGMFKLENLIYSPDGGCIVARETGTTCAGTIHFWDNATGRCVRTIKGIGETFSPGTLAFSPDGRHIVAGSFNRNSMELWDTQTGGCRWTQHTGTQHTRPGEKSENCFVVSPDGRIASVLSPGESSTLRRQSSTLKIRDLESGNVLKRYELAYKAIEVVFWPDCTGLIIVGGNGKVEGLVF